MLSLIYMDVTKSILECDRLQASKSAPAANTRVPTALQTPESPQKVLIFEIPRECP